MYKLLLVLQLALVVLAVDYTGHKVYRVTPEKKAHFDWLHTLPKAGLEVDFWKEASAPGRSVDIQISAKDELTLTNALTSLNIPHHVMIEDVQVHFDKNREANTKAKQGKNPEQHRHDFSFYLEYDELIQWTQDVTTDCGSRCTLYSSIGLSYEGRDLPVMKITNGDGDDTKENLWIDAGNHAREWISEEVAMYISEQLIYEFGGGDPEVDTILNAYNVYVMPIINADGYVYSWTDDRAWRKTRRPNDDVGSSCVGTDANRNYDFMWLTIGASDNPCDSSYAGFAPHSEPETQALSDFVLGLSTPIKFFFTLHSYGQLWLTPWGYTYDFPPCYDELLRAGQLAVDAQEAVHGEQYDVGAASSILYPSSGTSRDWAYGVPQAHYVYTLELRDTGADGFVLPPDQILPTSEETWPAWKALVLTMNPTGC